MAASACAIADVLFADVADPGRAQYLCLALLLLLFLLLCLLLLPKPLATMPLGRSSCSSKKIHFAVRWIFVPSAIFRLRYRNPPNRRSLASKKRRAPLL